MSTTNFEQRLTALFDTGKKQKAEALAQLQKAKKASRALEDKAAVEAACTAAERAYSAAVADADAILNAGRAALRTELKEAVHRQTIVNPSDVISAAITLLDSDVLVADDLLALADRYSDNPTMLRLVMSCTRQAIFTASVARDHAEQDALGLVIDKCQSYLNADLIAFDRLDAELAGEQAD